MVLADMDEAQRSKLALVPMIGPFFWPVMLWIPGAAGAGAALWAAFCSKSSKTAEQVLTISSEAFLIAIFSMTCFQLPIYSRWRLLVEGDLGTAPWIHRCAGFVEGLVLLLRGTALKHLFQSGVAKELQVEVSRKFSLAHLLTYQLLGGALYVWPFGTKYATGMIPASLTLLTSGIATDYWMRLGNLPAKERIGWHVGSGVAALLGMGMAVVLHDPTRYIPRSKNKTDL
mmetsp:Transcript_15142/g.32657  ORF Transcript_15142/g.32657 Transcript_15142/m.32657 type:complete len:229 (+) Transcript_15142:60-746(+)